MDEKTYTKINFYMYMPNWVSFNVRDKKIKEVFNYYFPGYKILCFMSLKVGWATTMIEYQLKLPTPITEAQLSSIEKSAKEFFPNSYIYFFTLYSLAF